MLDVRSSGIAPLELCRGFTPGGTRLASYFGHRQIQRLMRSKLFARPPAAGRVQGMQGVFPMQVDDIFQLLTEDDRKKLFEEARRQTLRRGECLFRKGDVQPNLYVLRRGQVRVEREHQGQPSSPSPATAPVSDVVGEISYLEKRPAFGVVVAEEDVEVDGLAGDRIEHLLNADRAFAARFYHSLALCLAERLLQIMPGIKPHEAFKVAGGTVRTCCGRAN